MGVYGKSAVLIFRLIGVLSSLYTAFAWGAYAICWGAGLAVRHYSGGDTASGVGFILFGVLLYIFSKPLGKLVASGLD